MHEHIKLLLLYTRAVSEIA